MSHKHLALLERDVQILEFIAKFGYCLDRHIEFLCTLTPKYCLKVIKRLVDAELVERKRVLAYKDAYLFLTKDWAKFLDVNSPQKAVLHTLTHDTLLVDLYFKLSNNANNVDSIEIKTDKEIRLFLGLHNLNDSLRIPDLLINNHIAIELELSEKPASRLETIINSYIMNNDITEVNYYLINDRLLKKIFVLTKAHPKFKFHMLALDNDKIVKIEPYQQDLQNFNNLQMDHQNHNKPKKFGAYTFTP